MYVYLQIDLFSVCIASQYTSTQPLVSDKTHARNA